MDKLNLILASASLARKNLLTNLNIPFQVLVSKIDEEKIQFQDPLLTIKNRAKIKGETVEKMLTQKKLNKKKSFLIIAADSMVVYKGKTFGKIVSKVKQKELLLKILSGKTHRFATSVWIKNTRIQKLTQNTLISKVTFKKLSEKEVVKYINSTDLSKYAGAYTLFNTPQNFIIKIEGSLTNVLGLPYEIVLPCLEENKIW